MFDQGSRPAAVAAALGVCCQAASVWFKHWQSQGEEGLKAAYRAGRARRLTADQLAQVEADLLRECEPVAFPLSSGRCAG